MGKNIMSYLISVVLPVYNCEKYLRDSLDSIANQTLGIENIEVIIVDDCSTDNSFEIAKEYESKYPSIKTVQHEYNQGCGPGRNTGLKYVTTDYVTYLDGDDIVSENAYERSLEIFNNDKEVDLVLFRWEEFDENGLLNTKDLCKDLLKEDKIITDIKDYPEIIFATYAYIKVYSRKLFKYLDFPERNYQDNVVSARVMKNSKRIYVAGDIIVYYRQHDIQSTRKPPVSKYLDVLNSSRQVIDLREDCLDYYDLISFLSLKLVYHCIWYICKSRNFTVEDGEIIFPILKEFPKFFSKDMLKKYQDFFPNYLPCSEQSLWDIENMDFWEYVLKNRYQNDMTLLNDENFSLRKEINILKDNNSSLISRVKNLEDENSSLKNQNKTLNNRISQYKSRKIVRLADKIRKIF